MSLLEPNTNICIKTYVFELRQYCSDLKVPVNGILYLIFRRHSFTQISTVQFKLLLACQDFEHERTDK